MVSLFKMVSKSYKKVVFTIRFGKVLVNKKSDGWKWTNFSYFGYIMARITPFLPFWCGFKSNKRSHSGDDGDEDPPVPIPNTEVKLIYGESSWHRAPARIANCRISIKNDRFSVEKRSFFLYLHFLTSSRFQAFQPRFGSENYLVFLTFRINSNVFLTA